MLKTLFSVGSALLCVGSDVLRCCSCCVVSVVAAAAAVAVAVVVPVVIAYLHASAAEVSLNRIPQQQHYLSPRHHSCYAVRHQWHCCVCRGCIKDKGLACSNASVVSTYCTTASTGSA